MQEAINNPTAALESLSEADCTIRILKKMLKQECEEKHSMLVLYSTFSLLKIAKDRSTELQATLSRAIEECELAKQLFQYPINWFDDLISANLTPTPDG